MRGLGEAERNESEWRSPLVVVEETNQNQSPYRITALCSVFSPSRWTSWMGPSGRRASVLETCIEVNMAARNLDERTTKEMKSGAWAQAAN